ncbi:MAG: CAP domain-containing protein [Aureispira sp.]|nr:CAP domain-containing protein [Aureispira sp.]
MHKIYLLLVLSWLITSISQAQWSAADTFAFATIKLYHPDGSGYTGNIELTGEKRNQKYTATLNKGYAKVKLPFNDLYTIHCQGIENHKKLLIREVPYVTHQFESYTYRFLILNFQYKNKKGQAIPNEVLTVRGLYKKDNYTATTNQKGLAKLVIPLKNAYALSVKYRPDFKIIQAGERGQPYTTMPVLLVWKGSKTTDKEAAIADSLRVLDSLDHEKWLVYMEEQRIEDSIHNAVAQAEKENAKYSKDIKHFEKILKLGKSEIVDLRKTKVPFTKEEAKKDFQKSLIDHAVSVKLLGWSGSKEECKAGNISEEAKANFLVQVNYFRRMAGLWDGVYWNHDKNVNCQKCALMGYANGDIEHFPPKDWSCYVQNGARACGYSNLHMGNIGSGLGPIDAFMDDYGIHNYAVGHRRWIINPSSNEMGIGATPQGAVLAVFPNYNEAKHNDQIRDGFIAWPPRGYVPQQIVYPRWSFGVENGDMTHAKVEMLDKDGRKIKLKQLELVNGYGSPTIVWEPSFRDIKVGERYEIIVFNVKKYGKRYLYRYWVEAI